MTKAPATSTDTGAFQDQTQHLDSTGAAAFAVNHSSDTLTILANKSEAHIGSRLTAHHHADPRRVFMALIELHADKIRTRQEGIGP